MVAPSHLWSTHGSYTYGCIIFSTSSAISNFSELTLSKLQQQNTPYCSCPKFRAPYICLRSKYIAICVLEFGSKTLPDTADEIPCHWLLFSDCGSSSSLIPGMILTWSWVKESLPLPCPEPSWEKTPTWAPRSPIHRPGDETGLLRHLAP